MDDYFTFYVSFRINTKKNYLRKNKKDIILIFVNSYLKTENNFNDYVFIHEDRKDYFS